MSFRFQRSIKLLPGVRLNLSRTGIGVSVGRKGIRLGVDAVGKRYLNAGIPGTGLSTRRYYGKTKPPIRWIANRAVLMIAVITTIILSGVLLYGLWR